MTQIHSLFLYTCRRVSHTISVGIIVGMLSILLAHTPAQAVQPDEMLKNPALEQRARELSKILRCLVCQNQSIDDSNAVLAKEIRLIVREHITKGRTDAEILEYLTTRYGDFVLLRPPVRWYTILLWVSPVLLLLLGGYIVWRNVRTLKPSHPPLAPEEERALAIHLPPSSTEKK